MIKLCNAIIGQFAWGSEECLMPSIGQFEDDEGKVFYYCEDHNPYREGRKE